VNFLDLSFLYLFANQWSQKFQDVDPWSPNPKPKPNPKGPFVSPVGAVGGRCTPFGGCFGTGTTRPPGSPGWPPCLAIGVTHFREIMCIVSFWACFFWFFFEWFAVVGVVDIFMTGLQVDPIKLNFSTTKVQKSLRFFLCPFFIFARTQPREPPQYRPQSDFGKPKLLKEGTLLDPPFNILSQKPHILQLFFAYIYNRSTDFAIFCKILFFLIIKRSYIFLLNNYFFFIIFW